MPEPIKFWMSYTLMTFEEKFFEYGDKGIKTKCLARGGYKLAFLVDLVASYLFKNAAINLRKSYGKGHTETID